VTIEDNNMTTKMNTSQMAIQEEQYMTEYVPTHNYNLTRSPIKQKA